MRVRKDIMLAGALCGVVCLSLPGYAGPLYESESVLLSLQGYFRNDVVNFSNTVDLDSGNHDDKTTYLGIDYSISTLLEFKNEGPKLYLKLERNGPTDYDAPLLVHNTLMTSGGIIERYRNDELLPQVEEFWIDMPLSGIARLKTGLYTYAVGNGLSLNGSYENFGASLYKESEHLSWRFYYCRPDVVYKNHLGPRIRQDEEQGVLYNHNSSNFFAADLKYTADKNTFWPYVGVLSDYTSSGKRDNKFTTPVKRDILGTFGLGFTREDNAYVFRTEFAHNFGEAQSADPAYKDIAHTGYLFYADIDYMLNKFIPTAGILISSGNKVTPEMAQDSTVAGSKNRAFSCFSPLNNNLGDSLGHCHTDLRPIVASGAGYGLNYGVPRPGTFASSDLDNLIMPSVGFDYNATDKLTVGLYGFYLRSFTRPVGTLDGQARYLSRELGYEADIYIDYQATKEVLVSVLGGYFIPGRYYKEHRDDAAGSLLSPFVRGDGSADPAFQLELAVEITF